MSASGFLNLLNGLAVEVDTMAEGEDVDIEDCIGEGNSTGVATVAVMTFSHVHDPVSVTVCPPELSVSVQLDPSQSTVSTMLLIGPNIHLLLPSHVVVIVSFVNVAVQPGNVKVMLTMHLKSPAIDRLEGFKLHPGVAVMVICYLKWRNLVGVGIMWVIQWRKDGSRVGNRNRAKVVETQLLINVR